MIYGCNVKGYSKLRRVFLTVTLVSVKLCVSLRCHKHVDDDDGSLFSRSLNSTANCQRTVYPTCHTHYAITLFLSATLYQHTQQNRNTNTGKRGYQRFSVDSIVALLHTLNQFVWTVLF